MSEHALGKAAEKAVEEFKALLALAAYLYICLGAVVLFKSAVLRDAGYPLFDLGHRVGEGSTPRQVHADGTHATDRQTIPE